jgi:UDP-GlcNAc:undecaprenyl-phosphate GlcNAc-1-phosphate transferase
MIYTLIFFLNFLFFFFFNIISKKINLYDNPDNFRKIHKNKVASIGGFLILFNISLYHFLSDDALSFQNILFLSIAFYFFLLGNFDDNFNLGAVTKFILMMLGAISLVLIDNNLLIKSLHFSFIEKIFFFNYFSSVLITIFCFVVYINAFNFFDGINLQSGLYSLFIFFLFTYKSYNTSLCIFIIIGLVFFLYLNFKEKCFLGNNGSLLLAFVISYFSIDSYNKDLFFVDEIIIFMLIPGVDLIRLFFLRISRGLSPMNADKDHLHHYLITKFSLIKSNFLIAILIFTPTILNLALKLDYSIYIIFINFFIYFIAIYYLTKKINK